MSQAISGYVADPIDINRPPSGQIIIFKNILDGLFYAKLDDGSLQLLGGASGPVNTGGGTVGRHAKFIGPVTIADSLISESGFNVTVDGNFLPDATANNRTLGSTAQRFKSIALVDTIDYSSDLLFQVSGMTKATLSTAGFLTLLSGQGIDVTATGGADVFNIGTANADIINLGWSGATVNIIGTLLYENVTNLQVKDKLFTINKDGAAASGFSAGMEIEEGGVITAYITTNAARTGWTIKAPTTFESNILLSSLTANRTYTLPNADGTFMVGTITLNTIPKQGPTAGVYVDSNITNDGTKVNVSVDTFFAGNVFVGTNATAQIISEQLQVRKNQDAATLLTVVNSTNATAASAHVLVTSSATATTHVQLITTAALFTPSGMLEANTAHLRSTVTNGLNSGTASDSKYTFWTNNIERARYLNTGEYVYGAATVLLAEIFSIQRSANSATFLRVYNATSGTAASANVLVTNAAGNNASLNAYSAGFTSSGITEASTAVVTSTLVAGLNIGTISNTQTSVWTNNIKRMTYSAGGNFGYGTTSFGTGAVTVFSVANGTAPSTSPADVTQFYSADQAAGNACFHTRTELGDVVKLFKGAAVADAAGGATIDAEARTAINSLLARMRVTGGNGLIAD